MQPDVDSLDGLLKPAFAGDGVDNLAQLDDAAAAEPWRSLSRATDHPPHAPFSGLM